jgi:hypothetical protein
MEPPPMRPASEIEWWGERKGRVVTRAALAGSKPLIEWILVHSSASSKESGGRIVTIRFASIVLPEPGGPTSSTLSPKRLLSWPFCFVSHQVAKAMKVAPSTLVRSETHVEIADTYPFMQRPDWK